MANHRLYGHKPFSVVLVHGGPGAGGEMAPVARELSAGRGIVEALQMEKSVDGQVRELAETIAQADAPVVLVGWSWGAWLSTVTAARHPHLVRKLILISSGPFEESYAPQVLAIRLSRLDAAGRARFKELVAALSEPGNDAAFGEFGALLEAADGYDQMDGAPLEFAPRKDIYEAVWPEAAEMRRSGELLRLASEVQCPVVAIHGDHDPHPAAGLREPLTRAVPDFRLVLLERCGHTPWLERQARGEFFRVLERELSV